MKYSKVVLNDFFHGMTAEKVGRGIGREVYVCPLDRTLVIKIEDRARSFQNQMEWETWQFVHGTSYEKWFAPCVHISPTGMVLVMQRTQRPAKFPDKMPAFLSDFKRDNYGTYKGHVVCHDYGTNLLMQNGLSQRMKKVKWWDE